MNTEFMEFRKMNNSTTHFRFNTLTCLEASAAMQKQMNTFHG